MLLAFQAEQPNPAHPSAQPAGGRMKAWLKSVILRERSWRPKNLYLTQPEILRYAQNDNRLLRQPLEHTRKFAPLFVLGLFIVLTVVMTFPLALEAGHSLIGTDSNALNDSYFGVWIFGWQAHQLLADPLHLFEGNIFYSLHNTLAFSEIIFPEALMYLPLELATGNPILAYNIVVLSLFALNGLAMYLYALDWMNRHSAQPMNGRRMAAALLAGTVFAFCNYKFGEIRHVQLLSAQWMPLALMYLERGLRKPSSKSAFLTALFFTLNALTSLYYALFLTLAMALYVFVDWITRRYRPTRAQFVFAAKAGAIAVLMTAPFLVPFLQVEAQYHFSADRDPRLFAARPASYLASTGTNWLYGSATQDLYVAAKGQPLFPGLAALVLAAAGFIAWRWRSVAFFGLLAVSAFVLSFGPALLLGRDITTPFPHALPYYWLSLILIPLKSLNAPARFAVLVMLPIALLAALGAERLAARFPRRGGVLLVGLIGLILLEVAAMPLPLDPAAAGAEVSPVYAYLAAQPHDQPVVEVPMGDANFGSQDKFVVYTYSSLYHWQPLVNGYSTFIPPEYYRLVTAMRGFPSAATVTLLSKRGVVFVVIHSDRIGNASKVRAKLDSLVGIEHVQDFGGDWLYRIKE
jgi:hypothetical protein